MTADVLVARGSAGTGRKPLDDLLGRADGRGWLAGAAPRAVIQVGAGGDESLIVATVQGIANVLRGRLCVSDVAIVDPLGRDWSPLETVRLGPDDTLELAGITEPRVTVPRLWFEPFLLVTVTGVAPHPEARLSGVLSAQAEVLRHAGWRSARAPRVYEAHRLGGSDLAVACLGAGADAWWLVGASDVAVDQVAARTAGLAPADLPDLRAIARHELLPEVDVHGALPRLDVRPGSAWRARLHATGDQLGSVVRYVAHDARAVRRNVRRIPHAVRRRLPVLLRRGTGAA